MNGVSGEQVRAVLREGLGAGTGRDSPVTPSEDLLLARHGTAYFARKLNELADADLDGPSRVPGWSRRHVVAHVAHHARRLARVAEAARKGLSELTEPENQIKDVEFGATLPSHALRYLFQHSEVHLNVEWRDQSEVGWNAVVRTLSGADVVMRRTPLIRAREVWMRAVDLNNGGSPLDFPPDLTKAFQDEKKFL